ncbi:MAG: twin-arginine translocase TatA/TatE family subunit [Alphaproteobacteria bacterium]
MAPGALQIIIIILLVMVLFGAGRIPVIMENLAKGINSFKKGLKEEDEDASSSSSSSRGGNKPDDKTAARDTEAE